MTTPRDPGSVDLLLGPARVVEVLTSAAPTGKEVVDAVSTEAVPFEKIKHLCSCKPLLRPTPFDRPQNRT